MKVTRSYSVRATSATPSLAVGCGSHPSSITDWTSMPSRWVEQFSAASTRSATMVLM
ncbi:hypothetical protein ACFFX0_09115 [Citricoccus parietis]|uniref:Uncharacterized protein n=1 Tax=Citricoccus parietis TaxID=592307 RepID=A0ABV5FXE2_9MICC